jgi:hypothetical protein
MTKAIPSALRNSTNASVLDYIQDCSAHSDVVETLAEAVAPLGDVQTFCSDPSTYRYVLVSTRDVIFGLAVGMKTVAFRLDPPLKDRALQTGATDLLEAGPDWVSFTLFRDDWPEVDLVFWARKAYVFARETGGV